MSTRADFYVMDHDGSMEWLGSAVRDGYPDGIPLKIIIQGDKVMFEETVLEYLKMSDGVIRQNGEGWPWLWADSRMTDYSYIFHVCTGKVLMCHFGSRPVDALKVLQGMDMIGADVGMGKITFPVMKKEVLDMTEETMKLVEEYGSKPTETV